MRGESLCAETLVCFGLFTRRSDQWFSGVVLGGVMGAEVGADVGVVVGNSVCFAVPWGFQRVQRPWRSPSCHRPMLRGLALGYHVCQSPWGVPRFHAPSERRVPLGYHVSLMPISSLFR